MSPNAKAISFTPDVLKAKLRALEEYGRIQTRRPVRLDWIECLGEPDAWERNDNGAFRSFDHMENEMRRFCGPFGIVGGRLWVRERARVLEYAHGASGPMVRIAYVLDDAASNWLPYPPRLREPVVGRCIPNGVHREGARHFLEVVEVRAERVTETSEEDALLEGICSATFIPDDGFPPSIGYMLGKDDKTTPLHPTAAGAYFALYDSIYGDGAHSRDWCWVYTLKRAT
jgi:hypothetical protein